MFCTFSPVFDDNSATLRPSVLTVCNKNNDEGKTNETSSSVHSGTSNSSLEMGTTATSALSSSDSSNLLTCQVSKFNVNPAPLFSFSVNGEAFDSPVTGEDTGSHYVRHFRFELKSGGRHFVRCLVTNPIFTDLQQEVHKPVWVQGKAVQRAASFLPELTSHDRCMLHEGRLLSTLITHGHNYIINKLISHNLCMFHGYIDTTCIQFLN